MARSLPTLHDFYYLDHFHEMIQFIRDHAPDVMEEQERDFLTQFGELSREAKAVYVRLSNRKGRFFTRKSLRYPEIRQLDRALQELLASRFISMPGSSHFTELIKAMTKADLLDALENIGEDLRGIRSQSKQKIVELAARKCSFEGIEEQGFTSRFIIQRKCRVTEYLQFVFLGRISDNFQAFTLRDLGLLNSKSHPERIQPRYRTAEQAKAAFFHAKLRSTISLADKNTLIELTSDCPSWPSQSNCRSLNLLGKALEQKGEPDLALEVYARSTTHPARERTCRLLFSKGERAGIRTLLREMISDPECDDELLFAEEFYRLKFKGKRVGRLTKTLRQSEVIVIDESLKAHPEEAAASYFRNQGIPTHYSENQFWMALFGSYFWDELFANTPNQFDPRSTTLLDGSFLSDNQMKIDEKLKSLNPEFVLRTYQHHFGERNGLFQWRKEDLGLLLRFLNNGPREGISKALKRIACDPRRNSRGYPDLIQITPGSVRFIEIKTQGDQIKRHQLAQIEALRSCGFTVDVNRIKWGINPAQSYVVVDVETTGGQADYHRVTEIGAVKLIGNIVVDTFQTLINPERRIPGKISELTGITNKMVHTAPIFAEISSEFREFLGDSIFVAHNARFDYGFIKREFARLEITFRSPTLCTVVEMKRAYPKLKSYSLANLCEAFGIQLERHHRALEDALATSELLKVMNHKRSQMMESANANA